MSGMDSPSVLRLRVVGKARPAGSKRAFAIPDGRGGYKRRSGGSPVIVVTDDCENGKSWRKTVQAQVRAQLPDGFCLLDCPLSVTMMFVVARGKSHYRTGRNADKLKEGAPLYHAKKPDVLKLARAVEDALTGVVWVDDSRIVCERLSKSWGHEDAVVIEVAIGCRDA